MLPPTGYLNEQRENRAVNGVYFDLFIIITQITTQNMAFLEVNNHSSRKGVCTPQRTARRDFVFRLGSRNPRACFLTFLRCLGFN